MSATAYMYLFRLFTTLRTLDFTEIKESETSGTGPTTRFNTFGVNLHHRPMRFKIVCFVPCAVRYIGERAYILLSSNNI